MDNFLPPNVPPDAALKRGSFAVEVAAPKSEPEGATDACPPKRVGFAGY